MTSKSEDDSGEITIMTKKRIINEVRLLRKNKIEFIQGIQDESNILIFYFLLKGCKKSPYENGYFIGKIMLPNDYPETPGDFMILTPNGRFTPNSKICLSNTRYHLDTASPAWNIPNLMIGIYSIWMDDKECGIGHIRESDEQRKIHAKLSVEFNIKHFPHIFTKFNQFVNEKGGILSEERQIEIFREKKSKKKTENIEEDE